MNTRPTAALDPFAADPGERTSPGKRLETQRPHTFERERDIPWPAELLYGFSLRMAAHGMCVSRAMMMYDRRYALQQLKDAHNLADDTLRLMAVQLFRHFESRQSGIGPVH